MSDVPKAVQLFRGGCACSQAVLATYGPPLGLPRETAMRVAAGFAGGMRLGGVCGAVTGSLMTLGLRHGSETCDTAEGRTDVYAHVVEFTRRFRERRGSLVCRELLECDISTPAGYQTATEKRVFVTICPALVREAAEIVQALLDAD